MTHIFVDFENVQALDLSLIGRKSLSFTLLVGALQTKLESALVEKLLEHAASVQFIRLSSRGRNALDFTLAYYVGRAVMADPTAHFYIISRDTGFDPLVEHLRSRHIDAHRENDFSLFGHPPAAKALPTASAPAPAKPKPKAVPPQPADTLTRVLEYLRKGRTLPKTLKGLRGLVLDHTGKKGTEAEIAALIESLRKAGHLSIGARDAVTYHFEKPAAMKKPSASVKPPAPPREPKRSMWVDDDDIPF